MLIANRCEIIDVFLVLVLAGWQLSLLLQFSAREIMSCRNF